LGHLAAKEGRDGDARDVLDGHVVEDKVGGKNKRRCAEEDEEQDKELNAPVRYLVFGVRG
jgi:hypothetical protein